MTKGSKKAYCLAALRSPIAKPLVYKSLEGVQRGSRILAPLGKREALGVALSVSSKPPQSVEPSKVKPLIRAFSDPKLCEGRLKWLSWMSRYYRYPLGLTLDMSFLPPLKRPLALPPKEEELPPQGMQPPPFQRQRPQGRPANKQAPPPLLNAEQTRAAQAILKSRGFQAHLLYGVTGSGKTEVYMALLKEILREGGQGLLLLPEIFLASHIAKRFESAFAGDTAILHSQIPVGQKRRVFSDLFEGRKRLLIGTRSALFCPLPRLRLIVVDEEHSHSFRQEEQFLYHARDSAIMLAKELDIPIVLGSATPSLSSWRMAQRGIYTLHTLKKRAAAKTLPKVYLADLRQKPKLSGVSWLSDSLLLKLKETLNMGKQSALLLNRRGIAGLVLCPKCGHVSRCPNCGISLTLHTGSALLCHYCDYMDKKPERCQSCRHEGLIEKNPGAIEAANTLQRLFPAARVFRADRDSIETPEDIERFIKAVETEEAQILIGTQMIAKGLDFPSLRLVGLIMADQGLNMPDFRAAENNFQLISQMAGRAGRRDPGEVWIQTYSPHNKSLKFAQRHDWEGFAEMEMRFRKKLSYPPFSRLCLLRIDSRKEEEGRLFAEKAAALARELAAAQPPKARIQILGPAPAPLAQLRGRRRFHILAKAPEHEALERFLDAFEAKVEKKRSIRLKLDKDPISML